MVTITAPIRARPGAGLDVDNFRYTHTAGVAMCRTVLNGVPNLIGCTKLRVWSVAKD